MLAAARLGEEGYGAAMRDELRQVTGRRVAGAGAAGAGAANLPDHAEGLGRAGKGTRGAGEHVGTPGAAVSAPGAGPPPRAVPPQWAARLLRRLLGARGAEACAEIEEEFRPAGRGAAAGRC